MIFEVYCKSLMKRINRMYLVLSTKIVFKWRDLGMVDSSTKQKIKYTQKYTFKMRLKNHCSLFKRITILKLSFLINYNANNSLFKLYLNIDDHGSVNFVNVAVE